MVILLCIWGYVLVQEDEGEDADVGIVFLFLLSLFWYVVPSFFVRDDYLPWTPRVVKAHGEQQNPSPLSSAV